MMFTHRYIHEYIEVEDCFNSVVILCIVDSGLVTMSPWSGGTSYG